MSWQDRQGMPLPPGCCLAIPLEPPGKARWEGPFCPTHQVHLSSRLTPQLPALPLRCGSDGARNHTDLAERQMKLQEIKSLPRQGGFISVLCRTQE